MKNAQVFPMSILGRKQKRIVLTLVSEAQKGLGIQKAEKLKSSTVDFQGRRRGKKGQNRVQQVRFCRSGAILHGHS